MGGIGGVLMSSDSGNLELALVVGFIGGIVMFFKGFRAYRRYRIVEDTPEIPIRSIPMGLVHIHGKATKAAELVPSPVSHTPCCFYEVDIERWKSDEHSDSWQHYRTDADGPRFYLEDGSGHVLVDAHGAEYDLERSCQREVHDSSSSKVSSSAAPGPAGPATDAELLSYYVSRSTAVKALGFIGHRAEGIGPLADPGKEQMRLAIADAFTHPLAGKGFQALMALQLPALRQKLEAKGPLSDPQQEQARLAMIEATSHQVGSPEFFEAIRHVSELAGSQTGGHVEVWTATIKGLGEHGLGDVQFSSASGRYRLTEYCILPDHEYDVTGTCAENHQPADEHDRNLITKGSNEPTFLISYKAEPEVESGLRKQAALMIFGGAGLAVVCLGILLAKLGLF